MSANDNVLLAVGIGALIGFIIFSDKKPKESDIKKEIQKVDVPKGPYHDFLEDIKKLFEDGHYTQAVLETSKLLYKAIQDKSGIKDIDGSKLIDQAFGKKGNLRFNVHSDHQNIDSHDGFYYLCKGSSLAFRNPAAHAQVKLSANEAALQIHMMGYLIDQIDRNTSVISEVAA